MMEYIVQTPHLPKRRVGLAATGERYLGVLSAAFEKLDIEALPLPDAPNADPRLAGHADLSLLHLGGEAVVSSCGEIIDNYLTNRGFKIITAPGPGPVYPQDCALNACIVGRLFIHRLDITAQVVKDNAVGLEPINVAQGYSKCSVCVVDERSIITADSGVAAAARSHGIEALQITPGHLELAGFDCGFIGGAAFKLSAHELAFTGRLDAHPDFNNIMKFLDERRIKPVFLTDRPAFDVGSILPLTEK